VDPESGGLVNLLTGAYLSSELVGTTEEVRLTDTQCRGEAIARVQIVAPVTIHPGGGIVASGTAFTFVVEGGSGNFVFSNFGLPGSGGVVSPSGDFQAGPRVGLDRVHVEDLLTGEQVTVALLASPDLQSEPLLLGCGLVRLDPALLQWRGAPQPLGEGDVEPSGGAG
jgi:hypothetical protein